MLNRYAPFIPFIVNAIPLLALLALLVVASISHQWLVAIASAFVFIGYLFVTISEFVPVQREFRRTEFRRRLLSR